MTILVGIRFGSLGEGTEKEQVVSLGGLLRSDQGPWRQKCIGFCLEFIFLLNAVNF